MLHPKLFKEKDVLFNMFTDIVKIYIKSGDGGNGKISFHREKYITAGGPDGGNGGNGGDIIFQINNNLSDLSEFKYNKKIVAPNGENGKKACCAGKNAKNIIINVPLGTLIKDQSTNKIIKDMSDNQPFTILKGGKGGFGNKNFANSIRQTPRFAKAGIKGQEINIILELKLISNVALIGMPNVGKSTILSKISLANPKIANYHFTTLHPNLGALNSLKKIIIADIPGIIYNANSGIGLGIKFLKHIERSQLLVHVIDISQDLNIIINNFNIINNEINLFNSKLIKRIKIIILNKIDLCFDNNKIVEIKKYILNKFPTYIIIDISADKKINIEKLISILESTYNKGYYEKNIIFEAEYFINDKKNSNNLQTKITKIKNTFYLKSLYLDKLINNININDYESRIYCETCLKKKGIIKELEKLGIKTGDIININNIEFEYII